MSAPAFTPGPWRIVVDANHAGNRRIAGRSFVAVAKVYADEPRPFDAKAIANANLIAAAPELYEALEACREILLPKFDRELAKQVDAALAKARGQ